MRRNYLTQHWLENVKHVCDRDSIPYQIIESDTENATVEFDVNEEQLEELEEDALCEKQKNDAHSMIPVYSYRTLVNKEKRDRLMSFYGMKGYCVLERDYEKVHRHCM